MLGTCIKIAYSVCDGINYSVPTLERERELEIILRTEQLKREWLIKYTSHNLDCQHFSQQERKKKMRSTFQLSNFNKNVMQ